MNDASICNSAPEGRPPLRAAYVARLNLQEPHLLGVSRKIKAQVQALSDALPAKISTFSLSGSKVWRDDEVVRSYPEGALWRRLNHAVLFYLALVRDLRDLDFVYFRYQRSSPAFLWLLSRIKKANPRIFVCVEIPTYPYDTESVSLREKILKWSDRIFRRHLHRHVDKVVTFSQATEIFGIPTIRTSNGVDIASLQCMPKPTSTHPFRLLGLANLAFWHGYDRVISGIAAYKAAGGERTVIFDVIGSGAELNRLQQDAKRLGLEKEVRFHGPLHGQALADAMRGAHVSVACIGMHRVEKDTSDLKSREFCACGLPFLTGYLDRDFPADFPFQLRLQATDEPVDINAILGFYDQMQEAHPNYPAAMQDFARSHLTWTMKMQPVCQAILGARHDQH